MNTMDEKLRDLSKQYEDGELTHLEYFNLFIGRLTELHHANDADAAIALATAVADYDKKAHNQWRRRMGKRSQRTQNIIESYFDRNLSAGDIASRESITVEGVYNAWHHAKKRGVLPKGIRKCLKPANNKGVPRSIASSTAIEHDPDPPITVGKDKLLEALKRVHEND